jgi:hypothetical protein
MEINTISQKIIITKIIMILNNLNLKYYKKNDAFLTAKQIGLDKIFKKDLEF